MTELPSPSSAAADVAVVMRTKNRLLLLPRALGSVLLQKFTRWHLYLVNDGGDREALEQLLSAYRPVFGHRLTVIHHETSKGMEAASNAALAAGDEEFVVVHDDDDSWDPGFLLNTVLFLSDRKNDRYLGVATGCYVVGEVIEEDGSVREIDRHVWERENAATDYARMLFSNTFPPICFLFRRDVIKAVGPFNATLPVLGDWDFNIRLLSRGDIGHIKAPLANYYHRKTGTTSVYSNSVIGGAASHRLQAILLKNKMLRILLEKQPEMLGLLMAILPFIQETNEKTIRSERQLADLGGHLHYLEGVIKYTECRVDQIVQSEKLLSDLGSHMSALEVLVKQTEERMNQLAVMNEQVQMVASWHWKMLRPVYKLWRMALPLRRAVAHLRGRT